MSLSAVATIFLAGCNDTFHSEASSSKNSSALSAKVYPEKWPTLTSPLARDDAMEVRIAEIVSGMSVEQKVAQMIQPEIRDFTVEDMRKYGFGSFLNGGGAFPNNDKFAQIEDWVALADKMYQASVDDSLDGSTIPTMWGTDAVHGHNNVIGATIFPHNIGLGAMNDPELMQKIGAATANAVKATGIDWLFAPTVAVVRDDRWGRTYEGYSEDPAIVKAYAKAMVTGIQGSPDKNFFTDGKAIATAKHFLGDGGTEAGIDQGNNQASEQELINIHAQGYVSALDAGVQTIMASFNSWHGQKMHGNQQLLTDVLKHRMGFDGLVVGDWDGHGQVKGCSNSNCAAAINAGVDIVMVPTNWKAMFNNTVAQVEKGIIAQERIDDAVTRILRVKMRAHLFSAPKPSARAIVGDNNIIGSNKHRNIARSAVRKSLVLLKNQEHLLPLNPQQKILVAGSAADSIGRQTGGWTLSWQGTGNLNKDFPVGTSIYQGIADAVSAAGGSTQLSVDGSYSDKPDVAVVVFGETPYAEGAGDIKGIEFQQGNKRDLALLSKLKSQGIPVVSVFLTGRPLWINPELNASDAFVVAWLPGTEGAGIADVILAEVDGTPRYDFTGKLAYSWPKSDAQVVLNKGDSDYDPLFPYGYGLTYQSDDSLRDNLNEVPTLQWTRDENAVYPLFDGVPVSGLAFFLGDEASWAVPVATSMVSTQGSDNLQLRTENKNVQEDARKLTWKGYSKAVAYLGWNEPQNLSPYLNSETSLRFSVKVEQPPSAIMHVGMRCGENCKGAVQLGDIIRRLPLEKWQTVTIDLQCLADDGLALANVSAPFVLSTSGSASISVADISLAPDTADSATISCQ